MQLVVVDTNCQAVELAETEVQIHVHMLKCFRLLDSLACMVSTYDLNLRGSCFSESDEPLAVVSPEEPTQPLHTSTPKKPIHISKTGKGRPVRRLLKLKKTGEVQRLQPCRRGCFHSNVSQSQIIRAREKVWTKDFNCRVEWMLEKFEESSKDGCHYFRIENNQEVCGMCLRNYYKLDKNFYYKCLRKYREGEVSNKYSLGRGQSKASDKARTWLSSYIYFHADRMPDTGYMMLPYKTRKSDVYQIYKDEMAEMMAQATNSFSVCKTCAQIGRELSRTRDSDQRQQLRDAMNVHNKRQMLERAHYYAKRDMAHSQPSKYMSVIIDGMDQAKSSLPHFTGRTPKGIDPVGFIKTHISGVINHGKDKFTTYIDINEYPHDANLVMNILLRVIHDSIGRDDKLPEVLYIQADNCARENKNRFMLGFCELLIRLEVFREVHLSFLMVGHTHEDIDAQFSVISKTLRKLDVETLPKLLQILPNSTQIKKLFNIKDWIAPHLNKIVNHSKPLHFMFMQGEDGVIQKCKSSCTSDWTYIPDSLLSSLPDARVGKSQELAKEYIKEDQTIWLLPILKKRVRYHIPKEIPTHISELLDKELDGVNVQVTKKKATDKSKKNK
ncbi:hypothetical protein MAR_019763 [Mya arenaria]|uniref:DUF7869 domain-containing protein n=1 Tax=Mya arenaria TaxID=6604 RepID=A0ABY7E5D5_MYAAR|nr:hypothetical protein MAR_019763 [Mya arenaria]